MILFNNISLRSGMTFWVVPLPLICLYPLFVFFDIYLTYLSTPDLKYESNIIINTLNWGWLEIIISAGTVVFFTILLVFKAIREFDKKKLIVKFSETVVNFSCF